MPRHVDRLIGKLLDDFPAVMVVGPRATGKTTTAERFAHTTVRLDRALEAAAYQIDPDSALARASKTVLLDEWQLVPEVLGAVKRTVDHDPEPGQFLVTGSVRASVDSPTWPGTGRLLTVPMYGLTVAELHGGAKRTPFLDKLAADGIDVLTDPSEPPELAGYVETALASGFPEPRLRHSAAGAERWLESYVDQLIMRDAPSLSARRDPERLRRYFEALALNTAGIVEQAKLAAAAGVDKRTASAYDQLLRNLLVIDALPAWSSRRLKRLVRSSKRHLTDAGLLTGALRLDVSAVLRDGNLLGRVLETFVLAQLRAEQSVSKERARFYHLRQEQGRREIDIVAELSGQRVIGIEVKARAPGRDAAAHLAWLRDQYGERFVAGVVLHTGPRTYRLGDRIVAAPIATLWS